MARVNSTPKGTPANRKGANQKKQKKIIKKKKTTKQTLKTETEVKKETFEVKKETPEVKKETPEVKKETPEVKKETPEVKKETPEVKKETPEVKKVELSIEDIANNKFEELAVAVAYAKNDQEKEAAVKAFTDFFNGGIPDNKKAAIKEILANRLKEDDFIYGSEFIDLTGLRQYQDMLFEKRKVEKEAEAHSSTLEDKTPNTDKEKIVASSLSEKELYQALVDGINNEEIKNIKGYSKEDLEKILSYQDKLLNSQDNGTAFESLHENSISDLKKFAEGTMTVDNDSYETMLQFIKVFGTNHKGDLTPEGKAAYDKLMDLMAQAKKEKIMKNKEDYQKKAGVVEDVKDNANATVAGILGGLAANAAEREKATDEPKKGTPVAEQEKGTEKDSDFTIGMDTPEDVNTNTKDNEKTPVIGVIPVPPTQTNSGDNPPVPPTQTNSGNNPPVPPVPPSNDLPTDDKNKKSEKKKGWWGRVKDKVKRNWKKIAGWVAATATAAALLFMPKNCSGNDGVVPPNQDDGKNNLPDKEVVVTPTPQDTIALDQNDLSNGFYLERSAGFKAEQEKINFHDAEKANKTDLLTIKKLLAHGELEQAKFVRNSTSKDDKPVSVTEIAYKMRIVTQNFPNSKIAASINNMFSGKVSTQDADNIYSAFNHVNDLGYIVNNKGKIIDGTTVKKTIDPVRMGPGSEEYGTKGADNNFIQVLKNHRDSLTK